MWWVLARAESEDPDEAGQAGRPKRVIGSGGPFLRSRALRLFRRSASDRARGYPLALGRRRRRRRRIADLPLASPLRTASRLKVWSNWWRVLGGDPLMGSMVLDPPFLTVREIEATSLTRSRTQKRREILSPALVFIRARANLTGCLVRHFGSHPAGTTRCRLRYRRGFTGVFPCRLRIRCLNAPASRPSTDRTTAT